MADFASLDGLGGNIPSASPSTERLGLTVPGDVITGTSMGYQQAGSPNLVIDSVNNRIIVNNSTAKNVLTLGKVTTSQLGLSVKNNSTNTNALFVGQNTDNSLGLSTLDSSGNAILFAGTDSSGNNVVKVAKTGFDARTATGSNLIFNSSQDVLKVVTSQNISVTATGGNQYQSTTQAHGLSFVPTPLANIVVPNNLSGSNPNINHANPAMIYGTVAGVFRTFALAEVTVDATNIYFAVQTDNSVGAGTYTWTAKVYLLQESFS